MGNLAASILPSLLFIREVTLHQYNTTATIASTTTPPTIPPMVTKSGSIEVDDVDAAESASGCEYWVGAGNGASVSGSEFGWIGKSGARTGNTEDNSGTGIGAGVVFTPVSSRTAAMTWVSDESVSVQSPFENPARRTEPSARTAIDLAPLGSVDVACPRYKRQQTPV